MLGTLTQLHNLFDLSALVETNTKAKVLTAVRKLIAFKGDIAPAALTAVDAGAWQVWMRDKAAMPVASIRSYFSAVSQAMSFAVTQGELAANPWSGARRIRGQKLQIVTFADDQLEDLIEAAGRIEHSDPTYRLRWTAIFLIGSDGGPRAGELENARWEDFDLDTGTFFIRYRPDAFGEYWRWGQKDKADRPTPLSQAAVECLYRLQVIAEWRYPLLPEHSCRRLQGMVGSIPDRIRKAPNQNRARDFRDIRELANKLRSAKGRPAIKNGGLHRLRKTAITGWLRDGVSLADVQAVAGHSSAQTTQTYYDAVVMEGRLSRVRATIDRRPTDYSCAWRDSNSRPTD